MSIALDLPAVAIPTKPQPAAKPKRPSFLEALFGIQAKRSPDELAELRARKEQARLMKLKYDMLNAEAERAAETLSYALHKCGVSEVIQKKGKAVVKCVRFCKPFGLTEEALYLKVDLYSKSRPGGVGIQNLSDENVMKNIGGSLGRRIQSYYDERRGFFYIVLRDENTSRIPTHVKYDDMIALRAVNTPPYSFPLGQGVGKSRHWHNMAKVHSMAVYGTSGFGKSNFINVALSTLVSQCSPRMLRIGLVDFKRVELSFYKHLPHVMDYTRQDKDGQLHEKRGFAVDADEAADMFDYMLRELNRRIDLLEKSHVKKISEYNHGHKGRALPYIFLFVDEWADIATSGKAGQKCVEALSSIARMGRFVGMGFVLCTQTPDKEIIPKQIRVNLLSTVTFNVSSLHASINMLGNKGAFRLSESPGRYIYQFGPTQLELQAPLITNDKVDEIIALAKAGKHYTAEVTALDDVTDEEILNWALEKRDGYMSIRSISAQFKDRGMTEFRARTFLNNHHGQTVNIFGTDYYIRRGGQGVDTRLIPRAEEAEISAEN